MRRRILAELDAIKNPEKENEAEKIRKLTNEYFASINKPKNFRNVSDGYTVMLESNFEELVCVLEDNGAANAKSLTTYEFFKRIDYFEKKYKPATNT